jgi:SAM-dependent methyltransferase
MINSLNSPEFWDNSYISGKSYWDLNSPTPAFCDILKNEKIIQPGKMIILGSGKGYDAVEAAKYGYEVTAVDFSRSAIESGKILAENENVIINFLVEDFFKLPEIHYEFYDIVYDYVTYCAINPSRRDEYARLVSSLLKPGGKFVIILFPVEEREGGPPFSVNAYEAGSQFSAGLELILSTDKINSIKPRKGREILQVFQKKK